jgi:hypothetical protein
LCLSIPAIKINIKILLRSQLATRVESLLANGVSYLLFRLLLGIQLHIFTSQGELVASPTNILFVTTDIIFAKSFAYQMEPLCTSVTLNPVHLITWKIIIEGGFSYKLMLQPK